MIKIIMRKIPLIQSPDLGCAQVSCLQYNVSIGMAQFGYLDQNRISLGKCCAGTMNFSGTQLKYDLRGRKETHARAVPSQHLVEVGEECECHGPLHLLLTPHRAQRTPLVPYRGQVWFFHSSSCFSCSADCCSLAPVNS